jgi:hypothetical protein
MLSITYTKVFSLFSIKQIMELDYDNEMNILGDLHDVDSPVLI